MASILIGDGDGDLRCLVATELTVGGHEVLHAADGLAAITAALRHQPDLILLDCLMPHLSGRDVCARLRRQPSFERTPIVLMTTSESKLDEMQGFLAGATDYIHKPFAPIALRCRIEAALG